MTSVYFSCYHMGTMANKEKGNRDGSRLASVFSFSAIGRIGTLPRSFTSFLNLIAAARVVEPALEK